MSKGKDSSLLHCYQFQPYCLRLHHVLNQITIQSSLPSELTESDGKLFDNKSLEGKPLVINLFASWCDPCKREITEIERIHNRSYKPELASQYLDDLNVTFVGINSGETDINRAKDLINQTGASYIVLYGDDGTLLQDVGAVGLPFTVFVNSDGEIVGTHLTAMIQTMSTLALMSTLNHDQC